MDKNNTFKMTYSAEQQEEINQIRKKYLPKDEDKMLLLRALDSKATKKANLCSILVGIAGTLILGTGMSMAMTDFGNIFGSNTFVLGIGIGIIGIAVLACAYPLYSHILKKEREKIAPEILKLTEELLK